MLTDGRTDGHTDGPTDPLKEVRGRGMERKKQDRRKGRKVAKEKGRKEEPWKNGM